MRKLKIKLNVESIIIFLASVFFITKVFRTFSGVVGESGGVWNLIQLCYIAVGLLWSLKYYPLYRDNNPVVIMLILNIYMFFRAIPEISLTVPGMYNFIVIPYAMAVLITFFIVGLKIQIRNRSLLYYAFYITLFIIIGRMVSFMSGGSRASFIRLIDVADVYYSLGLLPLAFIYANQKNRFVAILLAAIALIFCGKRAGFLALIGMLLVLYLINTHRDTIKDSFKKVIVLVIVVLGIYLFAQYFDEYFNLRLFYRLSTMSEDGGSGRLARWQIVLDAMNWTNVIYYVFGHGWGSVSNLLGGHAHSDYLELFYEYGLIALLLYVCFYISLVFKLREMIRLKYEYANVFAACIIFSLFISAFSFYIIRPTYITCGMLCYGLFLSDFKKYRNAIRGV